MTGNRKTGFARAALVALLAAMLAAPARAGERERDDDDDRGGGATAGSMILGAMLGSLGLPMLYAALGGGGSLETYRVIALAGAALGGIAGYHVGAGIDERAERALEEGRERVRLTHQPASDEAGPLPAGS